MTDRCLSCYQPVSTGGDFHPACTKRFFGKLGSPTVALDQDDLKRLIRRIIGQGVTVTGVQPKLSLTAEDLFGASRPPRITVVGFAENYILKLPSPQYPALPENEDLTMKLAALCGIKTAEHTLIRLASGELAYLTRRFDREGPLKIQVEDLCQLSENLTEHKYRGSLEKTGKIIRQYATNQGLAVLAFFELAVFSFLSGNADMHLKNFSLLMPPNSDITLAPAYDLVSTRLAMPQDKEESALTVNGKKNRITRHDFDQLAGNLAISKKARDRVYARMAQKQGAMLDLIGISFLPPDQRNLYRQLLNDRSTALGFIG